MIVKGSGFWLGCLCVFLIFPFFASARDGILSDTLKRGTGVKFRVVLDPGHGGRDSATRAGAISEKHLVLSIARVVKARLEQEGFEVVMTREQDEFVSLSQRALVKGDVFISLHANTVADTVGEGIRSMIKGMEIYTTKRIEGNENYTEKSMQLAMAFQQQLSKLRGINLRGIKEKSLAVLNLNQSPAILIELGFISNKEDLAFLINHLNYPHIASAFVKAIKIYRSSRRR